jgi:hypothetical protein
MASSTPAVDRALHGSPVTVVSSPALRAQLPVDLAGRTLWPTRLTWSSMELHGAQGGGGRIGLVNLGGIGSPTGYSSLVGS